MLEPTNYETDYRYRLSSGFQEGVTSRQGCLSKGSHLRGDGWWKKSFNIIANYKKKRIFLFENQ